MAKNVFGPKSHGERESTRQWDELIDKIIKGEVIPVIGPEFLAEDDEDKNKWMNPHQALINMLAESFEIESSHSSFSELLYDDDFPASKRREIYDMIGEAFESETEGERIFNPSWLITKLLEVCKFRFVITTSFTPIVENAMKKIWGDNVRVMQFTNNPAENQDITIADEIHKPTVYYMFGKVCRRTERYVVNDSDMLAFCRSWLSSAPKTLVSVLKNKYLLILGNNYSDWLCRFIWFSMKTELDAKPKGMMVDTKADESLLQFMKRIDAFTQKDPKAVIEKIENLVNEKTRAHESIKFREPELNTDIFISYSRRDSNAVEKLYDALSAKGLRVWYDKENLGVGDKFMEEIKTAIKRTRIFVPLLTNTIENEKNDSHPYRTEWETAIDVASSYGRNFIFPICEEDLDFYSAKIPDKLQRHNTSFYSKVDMDFNQFAEIVFNYLMTL